MRKFTAIALAIIMVLSLCACASGSGDKGQQGQAEDPLKAMYGTYKLYAMDYEEDVILSDGLFEGDSYITLKEDGKAVVCLEDDPSDVTWTADGAKIRFSAADGDMDAELSNGILALDVEGSNLYFLGDGVSGESLHAVSLDDLLSGLLGEITTEEIEDEPTASVTETEKEPEPEPASDPEPEPEPESTEPTEIQLMWNGWYYGCVDLSDCEGIYEDLDMETFDAVMYVELDRDGTGILEIYDPFGDLWENENNNCYVSIDCHADELYIYGDSGANFGYDIYVNDWRVVRNRDNADKLHVGSAFEDGDDGMEFDFTFLPWGDRWEKEDYSRWIPHFDEYLAMLDEGRTNPFGLDTATPAVSGGSGSGSSGSGSSGSSGSGADLMGSSPVKLDVNDRGIVFLTYPGDQFIYDDFWDKLKNEDTGVGILLDPMLGAGNYDELKASYEEHNSDEDDYSLTETTICGYRAMIMTYTDWLNSTMRVDIDFGGEHDGWFGISLVVTGDSLADCDTDVVWAIIESIELAK